MQLNPARGRKPNETFIQNYLYIMVYAAQPREGTETVELRVVYMYRGHLGLCSSTPRGDGNTTDSNREIPRVSPVYAAQPREGTETKS